MWHSGGSGGAGAEGVAGQWRRLWRLGGGYGGWVTAVAVARRGLHAEGTEPDGAGVLRGAAGAGRGRPARQPDHPRHAHHGGGRQRHGHQVSRSKRKPVSLLNTGSTQKTGYITRFNNYTDLRDVNAVNYSQKHFRRYWAHLSSWGLHSSPISVVCSCGIRYEML